MILEPLNFHFNMSKRDCQERLLELLELDKLKAEYLEFCKKKRKEGILKRRGVKLD